MTYIVKVNHNGLQNEYETDTMENAHHLAKMVKATYPDTLENIRIYEFVEEIV